MRGLIRRQSNRSKKTEIVNYYYQWQILKPSGKKGKEGTSQFLSKHQTGRRRKVLQEWLVYVIPRDKNEPSCLRNNKPMRAGHTSLKASLNRFNIVSSAECECGDGLQSEEHIFWDCKRYREQKGNNNRHSVWEEQKIIPKVSYRALKARRRKIFCKGSLLHEQHSYIYLKIDM
jgi:hypothetical protein